ncbi:hypothetical protein [Abyssisolibacter fermentans]|uniref:hypothetical protein n=1 Tax=Abyssisolibacter fermentans TaxID=1766203 RepID=UPI0012E3EB81|nr:hypothetical protein [Abyssisolibacter fermentans]
MESFVGKEESDPAVVFCLVFNAELTVDCVKVGYKAATNILLMEMILWDLFVRKSSKVNAL